MNQQEMLRGYTKYSGPDIAGDIRMIEGHQHTRVKRSDGVVSPERVVDEAEERGLDLIITDHNTMEGFDRALTRKVNNGYSLELVPAVEYTARGSQGEHKHIIALNAQSVPELGLHFSESNRQFHRQGATVIAAHPELGNYSMSHEEIKRISDKDMDPEGQIDGVETVNGGGLKAYIAAQRPLIRPFARYINGLPTQDLNAQSQAIFSANGHDLFAYGGSDGHAAKDIGDVIMVRSAAQTSLDAIQSGEIAIYIRDTIPQVTVFDYAKKMTLNFIDKLSR